MKTLTITDIMVDFLDSIRVYEHESGKAILYDERESSEFVDIYFNGEGKLKIEEQEPLFITEDGVVVVDGDSIMTLVYYNFSKSRRYAKDCRIDTVEAITKIFFHKSNADEYILWNKPLLSLKDIDATIKGDLPEFDELRKIAKGRRAK